MKIKDVNRFWKKVDVKQGCWLWQGAPCDGYGRFYYNGRDGKAHRFSYEHHYGPLAAGQMVLHNCHTRLCVKPSHLRIGTHQENMKDRRSMGRYARSFNGRTKIQGEQISLVLHLAFVEKRPRKAIAAYFGVHHSTIQGILRRFR